MPLSIGSKIGPYEIQGPLGAGGMGEVYRALDTQLEREVAIKVLPPGLANDPERLARFDREAKILASLNHPNIAMVYGLAEAGGQRALAMELVPGDTLAVRIKRGAIPAEEAAKIASQIAEALEAAHERGIVHRDLKPGNVMITPAGVVKVLDFGLAAMPSPSAAGGNAENSPTITMGMTQAGTIMGTAAYMSPEQASGAPVDRRADIWSFGVVLWEMLTGARLFSGESVSHTLADVLRAPVDVGKVNAPELLRTLLRRCLDRNLKDRLQWIGEARVALQQFVANPVEEKPRAASAGSGWIAWAVAGLALVIAAGAGWRVWSGALVEDKPLEQWSVDLGPDATRSAIVPSVALSPDGTKLVFVGRTEGGVSHLFLRRLDQAEVTPIPGASSDASNMGPFFSPDGKWIGFFRGGVLMKVPVEGGTPIALGTVANSGASWGDDNNIYVSGPAALLRFSSEGGEQKVLKQIPGKQIPVTSPQVLPGSKAILMRSGGQNILLAMRLDGGEPKVLLTGGERPYYWTAPGGDGYLLYVNGETLFGVRFDPERLEIEGTPVQLAAHVDPVSFSVSPSGHALFLRSGGGAAGFAVSLLDVAGKISALTMPAGAYGAPRVSPDGKRVAYGALGAKGYDVWVYDIEKEAASQLTFSGNVNRELAWAPDSRHLVFGDGAALWWVRSDGASSPQMLLDKFKNPRPGNFSPDGRLAFSPVNNSGLPDVWTLPIDLQDPEHPKPGKTEPFQSGPDVVEVDPAFSPDGKFIAYASNEEGTEQVFVRPFPGPGGRWKVSVNGGKFPAWSAATHELLFLGGDDRIQAAGYSVDGNVFSVRAPRAWSPTPIRRMNVQQNFDVFPGGKRVVMFPQPTVEQTGGNLHATLLLNFFDEVRRRVK